MRGEKLQTAGLFADAKIVYEEAIQRDPQYAPPYRALAEMTARTGDTAAAIADWNEYLKREPEAKHGYCRLAETEIKAGREVPALQHAEQELKLDPDCPSANLIAGLLYAKKSNAGQALPHLEKAAHAYPDKPKVQLTYGRVLARAQQYDAAEKTLTAILKTDSKHAEPYYWLGYVYARRSTALADARRAEEMLGHALALQPGSPEANYELGRLRVRERRAAEAIPLLKRAIETKSVDTAPLFTLSEAYTQLGKTREADAARATFKQRSDLSTRRKALLRQYAVNPNDVEVILHLGKIERERGDRDGENLFLQNAQSLAPDDARVKAALADLKKRDATPETPLTQ